MIDWIFDNEGALAVDHRSHPVFITTWHGAATVKLVDRYFRWSDAMVAAAIAAEQRLIQVTDLSQARCPRGIVQKRMFEHARHDLAGEVTLASFVVLDDPRLRGLITAVGWATRGTRRAPEIVIVDSMAEAIEQSLVRLRSERIPAPPGLDPARYRAPRIGSSLV
jgi:hypothetical protein